MVCSRHHPLGMESIRTKFPPLDTRETSVCIPALTLAEADTSDFLHLQRVLERVFFGMLILRYFYLEILSCRPAPQSSKRSRPCGNQGLHHSPSTTTTLGRIKRRTSVGCCHLWFSSFATSPTPITILLPRFMRNTAMVPEAPAMANLSII